LSCQTMPPASQRSGFESQFRPFSRLFEQHWDAMTKFIHSNPHFKCMENSCIIIILLVYVHLTWQANFFGSLRHCDVYQLYIGKSILLNLIRQRGLFLTLINLSLHLNSCIFLEFFKNVVMRCDVIAPPFMQIIACKFVHLTS